MYKQVTQHRMFGRGTLAGMASDDFEVPRRAKRQAVDLDTQMAPADSERRVDKHWSKKSLEAMTERDWRIFREGIYFVYFIPRLVPIAF